MNQRAILRGLHQYSLLVHHVCSMGWLLPSREGRQVVLLSSDCPHLDLVLVQVVYLSDIVEVAKGLAPPDHLHCLIWHGWLWLSLLLTTCLLYQVGFQFSQAMHRCDQGSSSRLVWSDLECVWADAVDLMNERLVTLQC